MRRRWTKSGELTGYKIGRAYSFDVLDLKPVVIPTLRASLLRCIILNYQRQIN